ncbi:MAG TPA: hypothetical protein VG672_02600 [Bryobacteraceae bacterium]|jgi:hypothetical protein|nr:hypothetical protein [Bryobacteraceae bacterium]
MRLNGIHVMYARPSGTIVCRDRIGNRIYFIGNPVRVLRADSAGFAWYGRVDFGNRQRFTRYVRPQQTLDTAISQLPGNRIKDSGWIPLPPGRSRSRRAPNQGMREAMDALMNHDGYNPPQGHEYSATSYAEWATGAQGRRYEWCHLVAHSMGGRDRPSNVVAASRGNNSEQLAIENILSAYRTENLFLVRIEAGLLNTGHGKHLGTVIRYSINLDGTNTTLKIMLDATVSPLRLSAIHQYLLIRTTGAWLNNQSARANDRVPAAKRREIRQYLRNHNYDVHEDGEGLDDDQDF